MKALFRTALALALLGTSTAFAATPNNGTDATKTLTVTASIVNRRAIQANATLAYELNSIPRAPRPGAIPRKPTPRRRGPSTDALP